MAYYIKLWLCYFRGNWLALMSYRADFIVSNMANLFRNGILILSVGIIFGHVSTIGGWTFEQVLFFYALSMLGRSLWHLFCVNMLSMSHFVHKGNLDRLLVRPANPLFQIIADYLDNDDWGECVIGITVLSYSAARLGVIRGPLDVGLLLVMVLSAAMIYFALHLAASTTTFWLVKNQAVGHIVWELDNFSRYPLDIYSPALAALLTWVVPFGFVSFYPAQTFFADGALRLMGLMTPLVASVACFLSYRFWLLGLASYQGTGS